MCSTLLIHSHFSSLQSCSKSLCRQFPPLPRWTPVSEGRLQQRLLLSLSVIAESMHRGFLLHSECVFQFLLNSNVRQDLANLNLEGSWICDKYNPVFGIDSRSDIYHYNSRWKLISSLRRKSKSILMHMKVF